MHSLSIAHPQARPSRPFASLVRTFFTGVMLLGAAAGASADVTLSGTVGRRVIEDNVVIASNTVCVLNGTIIKGNLLVQNGAKLVASGVRVEGNVQADRAFHVDLRLASKVTGDVQGQGTRSVVVQGGTRIDGSVQLVEGSAPSVIDALLVDTASVGGNVQAEKSVGRLRVLRTAIGGNLQLVENLSGPYQLTGNRVNGDLQFFKNRGPGTISGNTVGGNLQSQENSPPPQVSANVVRGDLETELPQGVSTPVTIVPGQALKGTLGATTIDDDLTIAAGSSWVLNRTRIRGNLIVSPGARLIATGIRVEGNVQANQAELVDLRASSQVDGDVQGIQTRSIFLRVGTRVGGNVQLQEGAAPGRGNALLVQGATIGGDVQAEKSTGALQVANSRIVGNLQFVENLTGPYLITSNRIQGDLQFFKNQGRGVIVGNTVTGNLQSKENSPAPLVRRNVVNGSLELE